MQDKGAEFMQGMAAKEANQETKILSLAQHSVDYVHGQATIVPGQPAFDGKVFGKRFDRGTAPLQPTECFNGGKAGGLLRSRRFGWRSGHDDGCNARLKLKKIVRRWALQPVAYGNDADTVTREFAEKQIQSEKRPAGEVQGRISGKWPGWSGGESMLRLEPKYCSNLLIFRSILALK